LQVQEIIIDYSTCATDAPNTNQSAQFGQIPAGQISQYFKNPTPPGSVPTWGSQNQTVYYLSGEVVPGDAPGAVGVPDTPVCFIQFDIPEDIGPPVFLYYQLTNFYQNHRRYVSSVNSGQLLGQALSASNINGSSCYPLTSVGNKPYYPCGLIANSMFNDSFSAPVGVNMANVSSGLQIYNMTDQGIAWSSDQAIYGNTSYAPDQIAVPPNWAPRWGPDGYTAENPPPNLNTYEAFQVWMRTAGLPDFSKLALRNDDDVMQQGRYQINITMSKTVASAPRGWFARARADSRPPQTFPSRNTAAPRRW
jgi:hypothetical protein